MGLNFEVIWKLNKIRQKIKRNETELEKIKERYINDK